MLLTQIAADSERLLPMVTFTLAMLGILHDTVILNWESVRIDDINDMPFTTQLSAQIAEW